MRHFTSSRFWHCFDDLPVEIQALARRNYELLKQNPEHPSLQFKSVSSGRFRSVRIGIHYRALGISVPEGIQWFWIGSHAAYDKLLS
ncbi:MAG: ParE family toxin-like protein [Acidithiobacillus ferrooxidans]